MNAGDKVSYHKQWAGGYRWNRLFPAVVVAVGKKTVRIRLARWERGKELQPVEQCVRPEKLTPRTEECANEVLLAG